MTNAQSPKLHGSPQPGRKMTMSEVVAVLACMDLFVSAGVGVILDSFPMALATFGIGVVVSVLFLIVFKGKRGGSA